MGLLSTLVLQGRVRSRDDLRRVYRRLVKRLHPDTAGSPAFPPAAPSRGQGGAAEPPRAADPARAPAAGGGGRVEGGAGGAPGGTAAPLRGFVDFAELRRELEEAEELLAELGGRGEGGPPGSRAPAARPAPAPTVAPSPAHSAGGVGGRVLDRGFLLGELHDLIARGLPLQPRALARNKAYRVCAAAVGRQLALLTGDEEALSRIDADMRAVRASSLSLIYHVMQVLWNGIDWGLTGMGWCRSTALRDYGLIVEELRSRDLSSLDTLLAWILELSPGPGEEEGPLRSPESRDREARIR